MERPHPSYPGLAWRRGALAVLACAVIAIVGAMACASVKDLTEPGCTVAASVNTGSFAASGGAGVLQITAPGVCAWTAAANSGWVTFGGATTGQGNGSVPFSVQPNPGHTGRTATLDVAGQTVVVTQTASACAATVTPASASFGADGGTGAFDIQTDSACQWTVVSESSWAHVTGNAGGAGPGHVTYAVDPNGGADQRSTSLDVAVASNGTSSIAGAVTVAEAGTPPPAPSPCVYTVTPKTVAFDSTGGTSAISVTTTGGCAWAAQTAVNWVTITSGASGSGNGNVTFVVAANGSSSDRSGTLTVAGTTVTITQTAAPAPPPPPPPAPCVYTVAPKTFQFSSTGGSGTVTVSTTSSCAWTASSGATWITITSGASGTGNGSVSFAVAANGTSDRTGTLTVAGTAVTLTETAAPPPPPPPPPPCTYTVAPTSAQFDGSGGRGTVAVSTTSNCAWTAQAGATWITISSGASGTGNGTVGYVVAANSSSSSRTGALTVAGVQVSISQQAVCAYALAPQTVTEDEQAHSGDLTVQTQPGCAWTATSSASWLSITGSATGSGNGDVHYDMSANPSKHSRSATITLGGQTTTVTQQGS